MKAFLEEYGVIIVVVVVVLALVVVAGVFGEQIGQAIKGIITDFTNKAGVVTTQ